MVFLAACVHEATADVVRGLGPIKTVEGSAEGWTNESRGMSYSLGTGEPTERLEYAYEGVPPLPAKWTFAHTDHTKPVSLFLRLLNP